MTQWRPLRAVTLALLLGAGVLAAAGADAQVTPGSKRFDKSSPQAIYHDFCSVCHGDKGDGKSRAQGSFVRPPRDFTAPESKNLPRDFMVAIVRDGKPGTAMVGWKTQLNDQQIGLVVDYIRTAFMGLPAATPGASAPKPASAAPVAVGAGADMGAPFPKALKGDATKGRDFYMKNCATCHGTLGDGKGPRAYFINPKPRNFLEPGPRAGFNRPFLFEATARGRLGTEMPAWNKVLSNQEIANVAEFVFQAFIAPEGGKQAAKPR
ncbi:MAG: c-type cytochrome [Betaproteobacteria bacterium]|nr:c-type cytochrome [Betaproteobacteria bacterium]